jgi:hypothetical protein
MTTHRGFLLGLVATLIAALVIGRATMPTWTTPIDEFIWILACSNDRVEIWYRLDREKNELVSKRLTHNGAEPGATMMWRVKIADFAPALGFEVPPLAIQRVTQWAPSFLESCFPPWDR